MKILLTGSTGGIGEAIKLRLWQYDITCVAHTDIDTEEEFDWLISAHGVINEQDVVHTFMVNTVRTIQLVNKIKAKNVILISSTAGIKGNDGYPVYAASKAALNMYCKSIAKKRNCYALCPGPTDTPMWRKLKTGLKAQHPREVAKAVEYIMDGNCQSGDIIIIREGIIYDS